VTEHASFRGSHILSVIRIASLHFSSAITAHRRSPAHFGRIFIAERQLLFVALGLQPERWTHDGRTRQRDDLSAEEETVAKEDRGFASMDRSKQREIASKGGKAAHQKGTAHEWTSEEAREAGRKGGMASHRRKQGDTPSEEPAETNAASEMSTMRRGPDESMSGGNVSRGNFGDDDMR
jgi:general stress protein YciG